MRGPAPVQIPIGQVSLNIHGKSYTANVMVSNNAWLAFFSQSLDLYNTSDRYTDPKFIQYGKEPETPHLYLVAHADGVNWDPGHGPGDYIFYPDGWRMIVDNGTELMSSMDIDPSSKIFALQHRVSNLELQSAMGVDYQQQIRNMDREIRSLKTQLSMIPDYRSQIDQLKKAVADLTTQLHME